jgi:hypothetical protein
VTTPSTPVSQCNHRGLEVAVIVLSATVAGLATGITLALLREPVMADLGGGVGAIFATYKAALSLVKYMKQVN